MISTKCKYAIRAILLVSTDSVDEQKLTIKEISEKLDIPQHFLGKILQELVPMKIISSMKGPGGGFYLTAENKRTSLLEIIEAVDGPLAFTSCAIGLDHCSEKNPCPVHNEFKACRTNLRSVFSSKTINHLEQEIKELHLVLTNQ
jgi:Rrf2 family transcriptional regulator, iron-sulfur cluster assembly transcription factor